MVSTGVVLSEMCRERSHNEFVVRWALVAHVAPQQRLRVVHEVLMSLCAFSESIAKVLEFGEQLVGMRRI